MVWLVIFATASSSFAADQCDLNNPQGLRAPTEFLSISNALMAIDPKTSCRQRFDRLGCAEFAKDPESAKSLVNCDEENSIGYDIYHGIKACSFDALKEIVTEAIPNHIKSSSSHKAQLFDFYRQKFLGECQSSRECVSELYFAAYAKDPKDSEIRSLQNAWFSKIDFLWNLASSRSGGLLGSASTPWMARQQELISERAGIKSAPESKEALSLTAVLANLPQLIEKQHSRLYCLNRAAVVETGCNIALAAAGLYGAAKWMAAKSPKLSLNMKIASTPGKASPASPILEVRPLNDIGANAANRYARHSDKVRMKIDRYRAEAIDSLRSPRVPAEHLSAETAKIWTSNAPYEEKLKAHFQKYLELLGKSDPQLQGHLKSVLSRVQRVEKEVPNYDSKTQTVTTMRGLQNDLMSDIYTLGHEIEHAMQFPSPKMLKTIRPTLLQSYWRKKYPGRPISLTGSEYEAIGSSHDLLSAIPQKVRDFAIQRLNSTLPANAGSAMQPMDVQIQHLVKLALEHSSLPRDQFIKNMSVHHGYVGLESRAVQRQVNLIRVYIASGAALTAYLDADFLIQLRRIYYDR